MNQEDKTKRIAELNDQFRKTFMSGKVVVTHGFIHTSDEDSAAIIQKIQTFDDWTEDDDPYGEHDFGTVYHEGERYFFKIDYYAKDDMDHGSEDPSDPEKTTRVMTIMRADEY